MPGPVPCLRPGLVPSLPSTSAAGSVKRRPSGEVFACSPALEACRLESERCRSRGCRGGCGARRGTCEAPSSPRASIESPGRIVVTCSVRICRRNSSARASAGRGSPSGSTTWKAERPSCRLASRTWGAYGHRLNTVRVYGYRLGCVGCRLWCMGWQAGCMGLHAGVRGVAGCESRWAVALAMSVLPVPGGPKSSRPW